MRFARALFLFAAVYGLLIILPMFFLAPYVERIDPPALAHPEYYYGFLGAAAAWQVMYYMVSRDPLRYRPMILVAILAKMSVVVGTMSLFALGRASALVAAALTGDLILSGLFAYAYVLLGRGESP